MYIHKSTIAVCGLCDLFDVARPLIGCNYVESDDIAMTSQCLIKEKNKVFVEILKCVKIDHRRPRRIFGT